jgi:HEAT repeat protein
MSAKLIMDKKAEQLEDHFLTYLLYKEGKSIELISKIRRMTLKQVENDIIKCKLEINKPTQTQDNLVNIISMKKQDRIRYIERLDNDDKENLSMEIYKRYTKFKNAEDRMILIWMIGELKNKELLPLLRMELKSNNVNYRRLACSALGKIKERETKRWLEDMIYDENSQVRQYAIKALAHVGDLESVPKLKKLLMQDNEKDYVKKNIISTLNQIKLIT